MNRLIFATLAVTALGMLACQDYVLNTGGAVDPTKIDAQIEVTPDTLNFQQLNAGDSLSLAVVFEPDYVPDTGDLVTIRYNLLGTCEG